MSPADATSPAPPLRARVLPPPLLRSWPLPVRLAIVVVPPVGYGLLCGAALHLSGVLFVAMQAIAALGGIWGGMECTSRRSGAARGVVAGLLFGSALLAGHHLTGGTDRDLIPHPEVLQLVLTLGHAIVLHALGAAWRQRIERRRVVRAAI